VGRVGLTALLALAAIGVATPVAAQTDGSSEAGTPDWRSVSAGGFHTCGIRTSGRLYCWGDDEFGQLGDDASLVNQATPVEVAGAHTDWIGVSAGVFHTCGVRATGRAYCWGSDVAGQLGNGAPLPHEPEPVEVVGNRTDWATVSAGGAHTCARRTTGRLLCWGDDDSGELGNGLPMLDRTTPAEVAGGRTDWAAVSAGGGHTCARRTTGRLFCWGDDDGGELGDDVVLADRAAPSEVAGARTDWGAVSAGLLHTCARRTTGRLFCWGRDDGGQLGDNPAMGRHPTPVQVAGARTDWASVSAGERVTCARRTTGRLFCWGDDNHFDLGDGLPQAVEPVPVEVAGARMDWRAPDLGLTHGCARRTSRRLFCWGNDQHFELGDGSPTADQPEPVEVEA
jgi:alpha-tubulin suppressor-like RCC1 family protein